MLHLCQILASGSTLVSAKTKWNKSRRCGLRHLPILPLSVFDLVSWPTEVFWPSQLLHIAHFPTRDYCEGLLLLALHLVIHLEEWLLSHTRLPIDLSSLTHKKIKNQRYRQENRKLKWVRFSHCLASLWPAGSLHGSPGKNTRVDLPLCYNVVKVKWNKNSLSIEWPAAYQAPFSVIFQAKYTVDVSAFSKICLQMKVKYSLKREERRFGTKPHQKTRVKHSHSVTPYNDLLL